MESIVQGKYQKIQENERWKRVQSCGGALDLTEPSKGASAGAFPLSAPRNFIRSAGRLYADGDLNFRAFMNCIIAQNANWLLTACSIIQ